MHNSESRRESSAFDLMKLTDSTTVKEIVQHIGQTFCYAGLAMRIVQNVSVNSGDFSVTFVRQPERQSSIISWSYIFGKTVRSSEIQRGSI